MKCLCGCKQEVTRGRRYKRGHNVRGKFGQESNRWVGEDASYQRIHTWLSENKIRSGRCEQCGKMPPLIVRNDARLGRVERSGTEFANISGEYHRDVDDYIELCVKCHNAFDQGHLNIDVRPARIGGK